MSSLVENRFYEMDGCKSMAEISKRDLSVNLLRAAMYLGSTDSAAGVMLNQATAAKYSVLPSLSRDAHIMFARGPVNRQIPRTLLLPWMLKRFRGEKLLLLKILCEVVQ